MKKVLILSAAVFTATVTFAQSNHVCNQNDVTKCSESVKDTVIKVGGSYTPSGIKAGESKCDHTGCGGNVKKHKITYDTSEVDTSKAGEYNVTATCSEGCSNLGPGTVTVKETYTMQIRRVSRMRMMRAAGPNGISQGDKNVQYTFDIKDSSGNVVDESGLSSITWSPAKLVASGASDKTVTINTDRPGTFQLKAQADVYTGTNYDTIKATTSVTVNRAGKVWSTGQAMKLGLNAPLDPTDNTNQTYQVNVRGENHNFLIQLTDIDSYTEGSSSTQITSAPPSPSYKVEVTHVNGGIKSVGLYKGSSPNAGGNGSSVTIGNVNEKVYLTIRTIKLTDQTNSLFFPEFEIKCTELSSFPDTDSGTVIDNVVTKKLKLVATYRNTVPISMSKVKYTGGDGKPLKCVYEIEPDNPAGSITDLYLNETLSEPNFSVGSAQLKQGSDESSMTTWLKKNAKSTLTGFLIDSHNQIADAHSGFCKNMDIFKSYFVNNDPTGVSYTISQDYSYDDVIGSYEVKREITDSSGKVTITKK